MTTPPPPLTDEDLSAVLDGQADDATLVRVQADPEARARIEAFQSVSRQVRDTSVAPLEPSVVDQLIGRALDAGTATQQDEDRSAAVVTPLPTSRGSHLGTPRWLVAAAIVVLMAVGLALVWSGTQGGGDDLATTAVPTQPSGNASASEDSPSRTSDRSASDGAETQSDAEFAPSEAPDAGQPSAGPVLGGLPVGYLGSFDDPDALRITVKDKFPDDVAAAPSSNRPAEVAIDRCVTQTMQIFGLDSEATRVAVATVGDKDVVVLEFPVTSVRDGSPTTFVTANDIDSCNPILSFERDAG